MTKRYRYKKDYKELGDMTFIPYYKDDEGELLSAENETKYYWRNQEISFFLEEIKEPRKSDVMYVPVFDMEGKYILGHPQFNKTSWHGGTYHSPIDYIEIQYVEKIDE